MRITIRVPDVSVYFEHRQIESFIQGQSRRVKGVFLERVVPVVLGGACKALEFVANNTADAHDYLIGKITPQQSAR